VAEGNKSAAALSHHKYIAEGKPSKHKRHLV
jgi:hypothetical protein